MAKPKRSSKSREAYPKLPVPPAPQPQPRSHALRETVESIVIAFVLAFLFRTFEAEAFVIPTGSMAPTLMGRHKDVDCSKCGYRFQITASEEEGDEVEGRKAEIRRLQYELKRESNRPRSNQLQRLGIQQGIDRLRNEIPWFDVVGGVCPVCRFPTPVRADLPDVVADRLETTELTNETSYNGDRILVNKYLYTVTEPRRWDVVVFKFPGNSQMNYIKRLVGLPGEVIRVFQGDLLVGRNDRAPAADFAIARKSPEKLLALRQLVHDTDRDPAELYDAGWPLRWQAGSPDDSRNWQVDARVVDTRVHQRYRVDAADQADGDTTWLRYRHVVPDDDQWQLATSRAAAGTLADQARPQLITDFNPYNTRITRRQATQAGALRADVLKQGIHWVGDLMVEADVEVEAAAGELLIDLVEGGRHFTCTIDLATGRAELTCEGLPDYSPSVATPLNTPGRYRVGLSNFDDELLLWINGKVVAFDGDTAYDAEALFGGRERIRPQTSDDDPADLAPVGIGARNARLAVTRLVVWRDMYYIADSAERHSAVNTNLISDFDRLDENTLAALPRDPALWDLYLERRRVDFPLGPDQFFVMGDNSPESSDARLWYGGDRRTGGRPGGAYLERQLLIGKALCVYWPHSWNRIPGTPIPFPMFPNFADMRLVR